MRAFAIRRSDTGLFLGYAPNTKAGTAMVFGSGVPRLFSTRTHAVNALSHWKEGRKYLYSDQDDMEVRTTRRKERDDVPAEIVQVEVSLVP